MEAVFGRARMDYCLDGIERSRRSGVAKALMVSSVELQKGFPASHNHQSTRLRDVHRSLPQLEGGVPSARCHPRPSQCLRPPLRAQVSIGTLYILDDGSDVALVLLQAESPDLWIVDRFSSDGG